MSNSDDGIIFNIQGYCIHDGPGIRTSVFLKGCPLRCLWCQNPESHSFYPELLFVEEKCTGCGRCIQVCPEKAIRMHGKASQTDRGLCKSTGLCVDACPNEARTVIGRRATAAEIFREIAADSLFYQESGGGVTLSGGEPLAQPEFASSILKKCRDAGFHTALDTCGYANWTIAREVLRHVNLVLFDFKHMNPEMHKKYTGVSNELILENARKIHHEMSIPMRARVTLVPGLNDSLKISKPLPDSSQTNSRKKFLFICFLIIAWERRNGRGWTGKMRLHQSRFLVSSSWWNAAKFLSPSD